MHLCICMLAAVHTWTNAHLHTGRSVALRGRSRPGSASWGPSFSCGTIEVQVLPAIRTKSGVRIADPKTNRWSNVVYPERFARKLTQVNQRNDNKVIPTVKLAKGLAAHMIPSDRDHISGYHMESLAIEAFRNYQGPHDLKSLFRHFADFSSRAVMRPITDSTGQSRHVDEYMGQQGSARRQRASNSLQRMRQRFDACRTQEDIENLFGV